jgi:regulator of sigma E protease
VSILIALFGLGLLIFVHESGHFFASLAVGLRPRKFYVGFPPAFVKVKRNGIEYGVSPIPLGGFVSIPGMHRPIPHDAERRFSRAVSEAPGLAGPVERVKRALAGDDLQATLPALDGLEEAMRDRTLSPAAVTSAEKGFTELRDALGPDAYWKAATWRRLVAIGAGPAANIVLAIVLMSALFMTSAGKATSTVESVDTNSPAQTAGLRPGDRVVAIDGAPVGASDIANHITGSNGSKLVVTVVRDGQELELVPVSARPTDGVYRLGFVLRGRALGPVEAVGQSFRVTGMITGDIGRSLGRLATGDGRKDVSSPIGITQASSDAVQEGTTSYIWVLAVISLSIALLNLLPLLPLDGGHILFTLIEGARGRFVKREIYERVSVVGLAVVLLLFFIGLTNDIGRLS